MLQSCSVGSMRVVSHGMNGSYLAFVFSFYLFGRNDLDYWWNIIGCWKYEHQLVISAVGGMNIIITSQENSQIHSS